MFNPAHYWPNGAHREAQETHDFIADWIDAKFFYSRKDAWRRFGMLGVFGDFVLSCTPGDICEIGVGESSIYLTHLARKYNRHSYHCDIQPGKIINGLTVDGYYIPQAAHVEHVGFEKYIDGNHSFYGKSSDVFFRDVIFNNNFALSFIDGDHLYGQVKRDFSNVLARTVDNGYILLHDTYPPNEEYTGETMCGTVYRLRQEIEHDARFDCITLPKGCAIDVGLTIVRVKKRGILPEYQQ